MNRILIIDDEPAIQEVLGDILRDEGYEVFLAGDGPEGLRLLRTEPVDVVFLDVWLPGKGGIDVLQEIKAEWQDVEVIIVSGHATVETAVRSIKLGAFDYLHKPVDIELLSETLKKANEKIRLKKEGQKAIYKVKECGEASGVEVREVLLEGHPSSEIIDFAENNDIDLIVMGTLGKTGLDRFLMGSVAEKVVRNSKVPVLVVRSEEQS